LFAAALIAPVGVYAAGTTDTARPASSSSVKESLTDTTITTKIKAEYAKEKDVSATQIHVKTVNGVVSLSGTARSQAEVDRAVSIARGTQGVTSVNNDIRVSG